jgi:uncharacterized Zn finger protein
MSRGRWGGDWDREGGFWYPPAPPKQPPPAHGIRVRKFGTTWWGARWIEALERFGPSYATRLGRGRTYARAGRVHDLAVRDGEVKARVTGSRPEPYAVRFRLAALGDRVWEGAIDAMAEKAVFSARLLAGEMPREIDEAFRAARASLFPARPKDVDASCTCPDWANPCKHVAAVHYVVGDAFDRDPFLLFELRGRTKDAVLTALRRRRARDARLAGGGEVEAGAGPATVPATVAPSDYERFREPIEDLRFHIGAPAAEGAILRQIGTPPGWRLDQPPRQLLQPIVTRAAALARELALAAPGGPARTAEASGDAAAAARAPRGSPTSPGRARG